MNDQGNSQREDVKESVSVFRPHISNFNISQFIFAPLKKLFTKSTTEKQNYGITQDEICDDLSEYFHRTYENVLFDESFDVNLKPQVQNSIQEEAMINDYNFTVENKNEDIENINLVEEEPQFRTY